MKAATPAKRSRHAGWRSLAALLANVALVGACREPARSSAGVPAAVAPVPSGAAAAPLWRTQRADVAVLAASAPAPLPRLLSETGLYLPGRPLRVDPLNVRFAPRYPLWTDGAEKTRFIRVPAGAAIDAADPEHLRFPSGTRLWKEFSFNGRAAETRLIERLPDGTFRYATYRWNEAGSDAELVGPAGQRGAVEIARGVRHDLPSLDECLACHEGRPARVLGFSALQLGSELAEFARRKLFVNLPAELLERPPAIVAPTATGRTALGYLYGNCAHCHNAEGPLHPLGLDFDQPLASRDGYARIGASALGKPSHFRLASGTVLRIAAGRPDASTVLIRMRARDGVTQMPPLGTKIVDRAAVDLVSRFIAHDIQNFVPTSGGSS